MADNDEPKEKCGVFGIYAPELDVSKIAFFALVALQHRGQECCGIATYDERGFINNSTGMGLVNQVFNEDKLLGLRGRMALGHTRYSTAGKSVIQNAQPVVVQTMKGQIGIAQNGNLTTAKALRKLLLSKGVGMFIESDVEIISQMLAAIPSGTDSDTWEARISNFMQQADGAYSLAVMTSDAVFGVRDYLGMRPLSIGKITTDGGVARYCIASETCALNTIGAELVREVRPGEVVRIDEKGLHSFMGRSPAKTPALCVFEYVYFARPDSILQGQLIHKVRQKLGEQLAREEPPPAPTPRAKSPTGEIAPFVVIGVPDSSLPAAIGYAKESGFPYTEGLIKNRYVHRTFIQPSDHLRKQGVMLKFNPLHENVRGRRVILVDDSIVRGNTIKALVALMFNAGAAEVHVRISSPPVKHPCFMGIDMATYEQLTSHNMTNAEVLKLIGADSLGYISHEGMMKAVNEGIAESDRGHCSACFSGKYPLPIDGSNFDW